MANFGRRPITDASKGVPQTSYFHNGEERIDRRPLGTVSRFVDPQGNVVSLQLASDGDPQKAMTIERRRLELRRDGFVEHAKCPVRHGTHLAAGPAQRDFQKLITSRDWTPEPCAQDPRVMTRRNGDLHAETACAHVEALIAFRRAQETEQANKRNRARIAKEEADAARLKLEAAQLEMVQEQLKEHKAKRATPKTGAPKE